MTTTPTPLRIDPRIRERVIAVRRQAVTSRYPQEGAANPDERPTWAEASCVPE